MSRTGWFLAQLKPNGLSRARLNLNRQGFNVFAPHRNVTERRGGRLIAARKPLFPGYLFVEVAQDAGAWRSINSTYGVSRLVALDQRGPAEVPSGLVAALRARCDAEECIQAPEVLRPGDRIRVVEGPFARMVTQIETVDAKDRIFVLLDLMGQKVRTEVKARSVERI